MSLTTEKYTKNLTPAELPQGGIWDEPGSSLMRNTGDWKVLQPVWDKTKCISCLTCWAYCPDSCIQVADSKVTGIELGHCKGCGICAEVCPPKVAAIKMEKAKK